MQHWLLCAIGVVVSSRSFVVIGGGIVGAFTTYFLARCGAAVTLIERNEIGGQASGNNPGGLNPLHGPGIPGPMLDLALDAFRLHAEAWEDVRRSSGIDFSPRRVARIHLALDDGDLRELERAKEPYDATSGFDARWIERNELFEREPRLDRSFQRGLETRGNLRVDPGAYTRALVRAAECKGARTLRGEVRELARRGDRVTGAVLDSGAIDCDGVVIATGPWSAEPATWLGIEIPIAPVKGEMLLVEPSSAPVQLDLVWREAALYPTGGLELWLGGTEAHVGFDREPSSLARSSLLDGLRRVLPEIGPVRVLRHTAALRPITADGFAIVGMADGWDNVCLALGGGRKGMLLGAAMGLAAAELVREGKTALPIRACAPSRFGGAAR